MILMPDDLNSNTFYKKIKEIITFNLGIPCQVLLSETLSKFESNQIYISNMFKITDCIFLQKFYIFINTGQTFI